jgi:hypothetical protein
MEKSKFSTKRERENESKNGVFEKQRKQQLGFWFSVVAFLQPCNVGFLLMKHIPRELVKAAVMEMQMIPLHRDNL